MAPVSTTLFSALISKRWILPPITSSISLDPVGLLTLFFDAPEKELMKRSGDMNYLTFFGLFVNPTTVWGEYGALYPGQGVRYYNPKMGLTSTVEVAQVNDYIVQLANGRRNEGLIVSLSEPKEWAKNSFDWMVIRPMTLFCIVFVAAASRDYIALGGLIALFVGQAIGIIHTLKDGVPKRVTNYVESHNVFFLANNVTIIVKSDKRLFVETCSNLSCRKLEKPVLSESLSTLIFMAGVLLLGIAGLNSKIAYLGGHALQAAALALYSKKWNENEQIVNSATWKLETPHPPDDPETRQTTVIVPPSNPTPTTYPVATAVTPASATHTTETSRAKAKRLYQRREAYVWAIRTIFPESPDLKWLKEFLLADEATLKWVEGELGQAFEICTDL